MDSYLDVLVIEMIDMMDWFRFRVQKQLSLISVSDDVSDVELDYILQLVLVNFGFFIVIWIVRGNVLLVNSSFEDGFICRFYIVMLVFQYVEFREDFQNIYYCVVILYRLKFLYVGMSIEMSLFGSVQEDIFEELLKVEVYVVEIRSKVIELVKKSVSNFFVILSFQEIVKKCNIGIVFEGNVCDFGMVSGSGIFFISYVDIL